MANGQSEKVEIERREAEGETEAETETERKSKRKSKRKKNHFKYNSA